MIKTFIIWANWACIKSSRKLVMWESLYLGKKSGKTTFVFLNHLLGHKFSKRLQLRLLLIIWVRKSAIKRQKKIVILQTKFSCYEIWPTNGTHTQWLNSIDCRQVAMSSLIILLTPFVRKICIFHVRDHHEVKYIESISIHKIMMKHNLLFILWSWMFELRTWTKKYRLQELWKPFVLECNTK